MCCCSQENCNNPFVLLPNIVNRLRKPGLVSPNTGTGAGTTIPGSEGSPGTSGGSGASREKPPAKKTTDLPRLSTPRAGSANLCAYTDKEMYPSHRSNGRLDSVPGLPWPRGTGRRTIGTVQSEDTILCHEDSYCFTLWIPDKTNKSRGPLFKMQGCWLSSDKALCMSDTCGSKLPPRQNNTHFCCCHGHKCNAQFSNVYDPCKHKPSILPPTTTRSQVPDAVDPIHNRSYAEKPMILTLAVLPSVSLLAVLSFLVYRLCLSSKRASSLNSSAATGTDTELGENSTGPPTPKLNLEDVKVLDLIVRGRYSEVRRGTLNGKDVAVKIYQHHHRQVSHKHKALFKPAIAHRDVNTRNILVKSDLTCVIADLGFAVGVMGSKVIRNGKTEVAEQCSLADVGTLRYMAPEVFDGAVNLRDCEASLKQIDVYALGLVLWELASRCMDLYQGAPMPDYQLPFQAETGSHPLFEELQVLVVKYKTRPKFPEVWKDTHPAVRSLKETIQDCWDSDADARLTALCVLERIADMATLWVHSSKRKREVKPTLNADLWPEASCASNTVSMPGIISNGVSVLPSFVDGDSTDGAVVPELQGCNRDADVQILPVVRYKTNRHVPNRSCPANLEGDEEDVPATAPLINSNLNKLTRKENDESSYETKRVREWLQEQSMSNSTVDTLLPMTPVSDRNQNLIDCDIGELLYSQPGPSTVVAQPPLGALKANNVLLAERKGVISHPNQGRNPTVERNTHKRSDEELAIEGNLIGTLGSQSSGGSDTLGPLAKRKGSVDNQSVPAAGQGYSMGGNLEGSDGGGELSSLVQHDLLNGSHTQQQQQPARNAPIPFLQNQVHKSTAALMRPQSAIMRPKLANINVGTNRSSYSHPVREATGNSDGGRDLSMSYPQWKTSNSALSVDKKENSSEAKSLKTKLTKLIRPKDLGYKFSALIFGGKKKNTGQENHDQPDNCHVGSDSGPDDPVKMPHHYDNSGLDASPQNEYSKFKVDSACPTVPMQVRLSNGKTVSSTCQHDPSMTASNSTSFPAGGSCNRLSNTDVRLTGFQDTHFKSPTLFAKCDGTEEILPSSTKKDNLFYCKDNVNVNAVSILNESETNNACQFINGLSAHIANQNLESSSPPVHDQNINTHTHSAVAEEFPIAKHSSSPHTNALEMNILCTHDQNLMTNQYNKDKLINEHIARPSNLLSNGLSDTSHHIQTQSGNTQPEAELQNSAHSLPDTKGGDSFMYSVETESSIVIDRAEPRLSTQAPTRMPSMKPPPEVTGSVSVNTTEPAGTRSPKQTLPQRSSSNELSGQVLRSHTSDNSSRPVEILPGHVRAAGLDGRPARLGMSHSWHEEGIREGNFYPHNSQRPKSLSLNGHNYEKTNIIINPNICSPDVIAKLGDVQSQVPSATLPSSNVDPASCPLDTAQAPSFRPIETPTDLVSGQAPLSDEEMNNIADSSLSSSCSHGHLALEDTTNLEGGFKSKLSMENLKNGKLSRPGGDGGEKRKEKLKKKEAKLQKVSCASLDSSEKIRRRIKTPVSFKNGRLSLYDDRLMSQSLDSAVLYGVEGEEV
ncbi:receptor protein serine/threonine kinase [Elysia marginata]|uniref:receptor protein serine/threonine kinase n=1 Tax=Elysia marginata TaxID=1093978 RepID=A0AAV4EZ73_9GAST|nr:receptor protein serine/threonine kinase [Elysia marginata]